LPAAADIEVLIVDDQRTMRGLVHTSLRELGFTRFRECMDGYDALQSLASKPAHLIISDMNMPNMDGLALLKQVRANPATKNIAFIMLTSRGDVELVKQAVALGVNNYLMKPFTLSTLKKKLDAVFGTLT
jgi:two-component system, chemotaxis family, chemotaxis protein CheY